MFEPSDKPRLFALAPGVDFPQALVRGLQQRMAALPAHDLARVQIFVNTRRMQRRVRQVLAGGQASLLPRIQLVTDLGAEHALAGLAPAVPPLRRRLELTQLIAALLDKQPDLAPRSAIYDLADTLATLMDEMQGEGVSPDRLAALDVSTLSGHWQRSLDFIGIVARYFAPGQPPDTETRQRLVIEKLASDWAANPPQSPVIVAGSTGSRGTTALLMQAVARLPQGALILPGYDFDMPGSVWAGLADALTAEDHPQFRFRRLFDRLDATPADVTPWVSTPPPSRPRNALVSLSLRPAPVTDQWMTEGPLLQNLDLATENLTLIESASPREEALAIALIMREAAETDTVCALITPDRALSRQVTAALDRWGILPDDSAGRPLALSAPGRFLRHVAALFGRKISAEMLLTVLKHPVTATGANNGADRGAHLLKTRNLELRLRSRGPQFPTGADLIAYADGNADLTDWVQWLAHGLSGLDATGDLSLSDHLARHIALAGWLAAGPGGSNPGALWQGAAGVEAAKAVQELQREARFGIALTCSDYSDLFTAILSRRDVRDAVKAHPRLMIWGTLEARVQGADLVILGGLNDGTWPAKPPPDPWLNRQMRLDAGLLLPERQIGLSAHDYQQAIAAPRVVLSRARRDAEAETVPSRWLNRLMNLLSGLPHQGGTAALAEMRARGQIWRDRAAALDQPAGRHLPAIRPSPRPPVEHRPRELYVTEISRLIRDPYAVYAKHILRLRPLNPLHQPPDARERGSTLHKILEQFIHRWQAETPEQARARLMSVADEVLAAEIPWPAARRLWRARLDRVAEWFLAQEVSRPGTPAILEEKGSVALKMPVFTLSAKPDRIDELPDGTLHILDYKTGKPPSEKAQKYFDKQLLLQAAMAERGAFAPLGPRPVSKILYVGLGNPPEIRATEITPQIAEKVWAELTLLIASYMRRDQGYTSRRATQKQLFEGDYDHLARFGEWEANITPTPEDVG